MLWSTVSKAFEKSRKLPQENWPSSIALCILSVIRRVACIVECFSLKPNWLTNKMLYLSMKLIRVIHKLFQYFKTQYGKNFSGRQKFVNWFVWRRHFCQPKKAFDHDTIDHHMPLRKLFICGVSGYSLKWFEHYLSNRTQGCTIIYQKRSKSSVEFL